MHATHLSRSLLGCILGILLFHTSFAQNTLIKSVYFGGGSYYIDGAQVKEIGEFINSIPNIEQYQISISSYTDNIGGAEYNQWLSQQRSRAVRRELNLLNIENEKIIQEDNGQFNNLYDNNTHRGRMANRRVDIILTPMFL
ncbi:MAG: OmpA family protein [Bacteroidota bacterium]